MKSHNDIPVSDAFSSSTSRNASFMPVSPPDMKSERRSFQPYYIALLVVLVFCFFGTFSRAEDWRYLVFVYLRYSLWFFICVGLVLHLVRLGKSRLLANISIVMPFFIIGLVSSMLSVDLVVSMRQVTFWLLGILAAAMIGEEVELGVAQRTIFWTLFAALLLTILLVFVDPGLAVGADSRGILGGGSWSGAFPNKNMLGLVTSYAIIFGLFTRGVEVLSRMAMLGVTVICAIFSGSQGGVLSGVGAIGFVAVVALLRKAPLSPAARGATLATLVLIVLPLLFIMSGYVLEMLGRDATLTGRTDIWSAFLPRALLFWPIGAGPGSFTSASAVTADLAFSFEKLGEINSPHNIFIATLGETGIFGLIAFVSVLFYTSFVLPFRSRAAAALPTSALAFSIMLGGMVETREVFGPAIGMFLIILMLTVTRKEEAAIRSRELDLPTPEVAAEPVVARPGIMVLGR